MDGSPSKPKKKVKKKFKKKSKLATGLPNVSLQHWKLCSFYVLKQNRFYFNVRVLMNLGIVTDEKISMQ